LDQLINLNKNSHKEFLIRCESNCSSKCREEYKIEYRRLVKLLKTNNNKIICLFCSRTSKFSGRGNPNTKYSIDDQFFNKIDTPIKAYLLGWIASDGHINIRGFKIAMHQKDIDILEYFQKNICNEIPIKKFKTKTSLLCSYEVNSKQISKDLCLLLNIAPGKKSNTVCFPNIASNFYYDFIRGYFEGDGSVNDPFIAKSKYIKGNIRSNSNNMLNSLKKLCGGSISCNMLCLSNKQMFLFLDKIYNNADFKLKRKYDRYMNWLSYKENKNGARR